MMLQFILVFILQTVARAGLEEVVVSEYISKSRNLQELRRAANGDADLAKKILDQKFQYPEVSFYFEHGFPKDSVDLQKRAYVHLAKIVLRSEVEGLRRHAEALNKLHELVSACRPRKSFFANPGNPFPCQQKIKCKDEAAQNLVGYLQSVRPFNENDGVSREMFLSEIEFESYKVSKNMRLMSPNFAFRGLNYIPNSYPPLKTEYVQDVEYTDRSTISGTQRVPTGIVTVRSIACETKNTTAKCEVIIGNNEQIIPGAKDVACDPGGPQEVNLALPWVNDSARGLGPKLEVVTDQWLNNLPAPSQGRAE